MGKSEVMHMITFSSPLGRIGIAATADGVRTCGFVSAMPSWPPTDLRVSAMSATSQAREYAQCAQQQLQQYVDGDRTAFSVPVDLSGRTEFQRQVLQELATVPFGTVVTYAELARRVGRPRAFRAVANVCRHNPVAPIVPCHRVIMSSGRLGGYYGGTDFQDLKRELLRREGHEVGAHGVVISV